MFKDLGVGVGLRPAHFDEFLNKKPKGIAWAEVITENYLASSRGEYSRSITVLEKIREQLPIALHGVSLSIGSVDPLNKSYLGRLKDLIKRVDPVVISDHLCWTSVAGQNLHDLLPLPYTQEALSHVVERIQKVQELLGRRILIENVSSYIEFAHSEMTEWEFIGEILHRANCGILLDINNIYVSARNHKFDPIQYLKAIPVERIGQIHLAGHTDRGTHLIDTHDEPVCEEVWDLFSWVTQNLGRFSSMIERDDNIPQWSELYAELMQIEKIRKEVRKSVTHTQTASAPL